MKKIGAFLLFSFCSIHLFAQIEAFENHDVYYTVNEIVNHKEGKIRLKDYTLWKLNMPLTVWSLKQAIIIKDKYQNFSLAFIDGNEYSATFLEPEEYLTNTAKLLKVIASNPEQNMFLLANNEVWEYNETDATKIEKIDLPFYVILDTDRKIAILPMQDTFINVMLSGKDDLKMVRKK